MAPKVSKPPKGSKGSKAPKPPKESQAAQWYPVYKVKYNIALPDPDMPPGRLHHAIFVESRSRGAGYLYHVIGDITSRGGMTYQSKKTDKPSTSRSFHSMELLGYTLSTTHPTQWDMVLLHLGDGSDHVCEKLLLFFLSNEGLWVLSALPTPPQQKASNPRKMGQVEPFKEKIGDYQYVFYEPDEERKPLSKCTEWVEWWAIPALHTNNLILDTSSAQGEASSYAQGESAESTVQWEWDEGQQSWKWWDEATHEWVWAPEE